MSLDPARRSARVTAAIAAQLAALARSLEEQHAPDAVAHFLMRCLFTMFAEDVGLLPNRSFTQLLADLRHNVARLPAHGRAPVADDEHGRLLGDPAHAHAPFQRRHLCRGHGAAVDRRPAATA